MIKIKKLVGKEKNKKGYWLGNSFQDVKIDSPETILFGTKTKIPFTLTSDGSAKIEVLSYRQRKELYAAIRACRSLQESWKKLPKKLYFVAETRNLDPEDPTPMISFWTQEPKRFKSTERVCFEWDKGFTGWTPRPKAFEYFFAGAVYKFSTEEIISDWEWKELRKRLWLREEEEEER